MTLELYKWDPVQKESFSHIRLETRGDPHTVHAKASTSQEMVFRTVHGNEGTFWFFNLEKDSVQERPTVWNFQNTDWLQIGTQLTCYKQAALTADKEVLFSPGLSS